MNLVDNINFVMALLGLEAHLVDQCPDVVHTVIGGGIQFHDVKGSIFIERNAAIAGSARFMVFGQAASVERLCQYPCARCFANATRAAK